ncbi:type II secretion system protein [Candidatus Falkowbacteria bacterium]|jgi:prepilin-type N-terminal cleavage/methylation domain-containing protein|nr:type II secretion system protein [Elusimicrobiaceae bacterium]MBT4433514.1 type II secretion system protein [Candidatus Falkowbacteria bacterium]
MKKNKQGFTLIELLVVIAIIGILSTMAVVALGSARSKARDAKRQSDLKIFQTAIEMNISDNGAAPTVPANWAALATALATYLPGGLPEDPSSTPRIWCYCVDSASTSKYLVGTTIENDTTSIAGDLDTQELVAGTLGIYDIDTECRCSDDAVPAAFDCRDGSNGTVDSFATDTAICLGTTS